ncbi:PucR family transcriptional regulator [Saccharothrix texasensis]|uniref:PucR-like helix-turn-helix protein n=1 Tax=Saccharothrix texasensis TaxID=103734 RepID=A0A3N1HJF9_9PSEU|nr:PucR family transcriptional regulator [Saccharothrix texasensis]ROP42581.1 PucR-like helix-turn-helix protein [Saccharothrix texasensis]
MSATHDRGRLLGQVLRGMATDRGVVEELVRAARGQSPEVARLPEAENRRHVEVLLATGLDFFERSEEPEAQDFGAAQALGADRAAQGISIDGLLRGVQAARTAAMNVAIARSRAAGVPDEVLLEGLVDLDRYTGVLERHVINGYHTAELELSRTNRDANTHLLRRLLVHGDDTPPEPAELRRAGLAPDGRYHCLVSDVTLPGEARALEQRLLGFGGVYGLVEGRLAGLSARPPADLAPDVLLVVAPATGLAVMRDVHPLCVAALRIAGRAGLRGVRDLTDLAGEVALAAQPVLADLLRGTLAGLDHDDDFHRELVCTALVYLDRGQRLGHAAAALHVHPNTVRYRLDRLAELTGAPWDDSGADDPSTVLGTLRHWWALRAWLDHRPSQPSDLLVSPLTRKCWH